MPHLLVQRHPVVPMGLWRLGLVIVEPQGKQGLMTVQAQKSVLLQQG